ncbi:MAG: hypothetical protein ACI395_03200, partial [Candidatus Cryptobacteroides sp.]
PSSCMDHTTILPFPLYNKAVFDHPGNEAVYLLNGKDVMCSFRTGAASPTDISSGIASTDICSGAAPADTSSGTVSADIILDALCEVSRFTSLRIGDVVASELLSPAPLALDAPQTVLSAAFCDNGIFDFGILK